MEGGIVVCAPAPRLEDDVFTFVVFDGYALAAPSAATPTKGTHDLRAHP